MKLGLTDYIDCAHFLPGHPKCGQLHGHTYKVEIVIDGEVGADGMVVDFDRIRSDLRTVLDVYDHRSLNDFLEVPSVENICAMLRTDLKEQLGFAFVLRVWEGADKWAES